MIEPAYRYRAVLHRAIDGDTYELDIDLGFHVWQRTTIRLLGWNCPELRDPGGADATAAAKQLLTAGTVIVETEKDKQTFARWLARVWVDGDDLGARLEALGLATRRAVGGIHL